MLEPIIPANEQSRLTALCNLDVLDTPAEARYDRLTEIAQSHFDVPFALVSLVDENRQWFKSSQGLNVSQTPRNISFCGHAILQPEIFVIADTFADERFADNPLVIGEPFIRFYAGAPLKSKGGAIVGTLCIIDQKPRQFSKEQLKVLRLLADAVEEELGRTTLLEIEKQLKLKDQHLANENERLELATKAGEIGIWELNVQTNQLSWDDRMFQLYGVRREHFPGEYEAWSAALHPADMARSEQELNDAIAGNKSFDTEFRVIWPSGEVHHIKANATVVRDAEGNPVRMIGINQDITDRKKVERLKSEFVSTVSHELRTPLTSIRGAIGLIVGKMAEQIPEKALKMLLMANRNVERLTLLINDILDLEKIESGRLEFEFDTLDLIPLAKQAIEDNLGFAQQHNVKLKFESLIDQALINGDRHRLLQVFANLISNAVKYSPEGGVVGIIISLSNNQYRVTIHDTGPGIPEDFKDRIFTRFAQADGSDTRVKGGTGLGLSISKAIVERHHGSIGYSSEAGQGSEFFFELPPTQLRRVYHSSTSQQYAALICEDNPDVATMLQKILQKEGVNSQVCDAAESAVNMLNSGKFDFVLLDLTLKDSDGIGFLNQILAGENITRLPVIVVSGLAQPSFEDFTNIHSKWLIDWVRKPLDVERMHQAIKIAINCTHLPHILQIEDDPDRLQIVNNASSDIAQLAHTADLDQALQLLKGNRYELIIWNASLHNGSLVKTFSLLNRYCPVIVISEHEIDAEVSQVAFASILQKNVNKQRIKDSLINAL